MDMDQGYGVKKTLRLIQVDIVMPEILYNKDLAFDVRLGFHRAG